MNTSVEPEYELKHRLTGAAILVILAVVVIPLFLSEPALEANSSVEEDGVAVQTFRSRIVPLNLNNVNGSDQSASDLQSSNVDDRKPALLDLTLSSEAEQAASEPTEKPKKTALVMTQDQSKGPSKEALKKLTQAETKIKKPEEITEKKQKVAAVEPKTTAASKPKKASGQEQVTSAGWVVRVGTFSKQANVDSVSILLNNSGFNPKTKSVDTSLGKSTRVWLGPYAKRETADKISVRLKSLIGEKGYVTRTNS
ncbi:MAG: SPOR domain-containing protein [Acidiferrobacterales bacterium]|nr:SPOR domain-containing protein [Acidiferrobacterales bacterium]